MSKKKDSSYEVGYGKPPAHSQFQAGQSGNPKGRPKDSINLATAFNRALKEKVEVVEHGRRKSITKLDAAVKGMVNRAVKGDPKAMQQMLALGPLVGVALGTATQALDANDAAVLAGLLKRMKSAGETPTDLS
jgi:hypothetical protein